MGHYHRLTLMEREELSRLLAAGCSLRATAQALQRAPSTLSRELTRHRASPVTYRAVPAQQRASRRAHQPRKPRKLAVHPRLRREVLARLARCWSPEQIAHGLHQQYPPTQRCRSRTKPFIPISMGYPPTPSSAPSPGTSGGTTAFDGPVSPGSRRAPSRRW